MIPYLFCFRGSFFQQWLSDEGRGVSPPTVWWWNASEKKKRSQKKKLNKIASNMFYIQQTICIPTKKNNKNILISDCLPSAGHRGAHCLWVSATLANIHGLPVTKNLGLNEYPKILFLKCWKWKTIMNIVTFERKLLKEQILHWTMKCWMKGISPDKLDIVLHFALHSVHCDSLLQLPF